MRKNLICTVILIGNLLFSQVGINTDSPDSSAALDIQSIDKTGSNKTGILIPRVELDSIKDVSNNPARGLLVYNTKTQNDVVEDNFYYFNGDKWDLLLAQNDSKTVPELAAIFRLETEEDISIIQMKQKTPIIFNRNVLNKEGNLISYDLNTGIFTVQQDGIYSITLQVGLNGVVNGSDNIIGIITKKNVQRKRKEYERDDWLGRATFVSTENDLKGLDSRAFAVYTTYLEFKKGEVFQAVVYLDKIKSDSAIQGIQTGSSGDGNITNISIVKY